MSSSARRKQEAAHRKAARKLEQETILLDFLYDPATLLYRGPIIKTDLTITKEHRAALTAAGEALPTPVPCRFLIDTGADGCVVKHDVAVQAGLKLINANAPLHGVGVDTTGKAYLGRVVFGMRSHVVQGATHHCYIDTEIKSGNLETPLLDGLIGRDVLQHFTLTYDGKSGRVTMRYHRAPKSQAETS